MATNVSWVSLMLSMVNFTVDGDVEFLGCSGCKTFDTGQWSPMNSYIKPGKSWILGVLLSHGYWVSWILGVLLSHGYWVSWILGVMLSHISVLKDSFYANKFNLDFPTIVLEINQETWFVLIMPNNMGFEGWPGDTFAVAMLLMF